MDNNYNVARKSSDDFITIPDLWHMCVASWNWYVLSLILCVSFASYYLVKSTKMYSREMAVLVKQDAQGKSATQNVSDNSFNDIGLVAQNVNVQNVQRQFTSLGVLTEVARRVLHTKNDRETLREAEHIKSRLKADIDGDKSTIISMKYTDSNPIHAECVLSEIVKVYNEKLIADKNKSTASTSQFIDGRLLLLEKDLNVVDDSISRFKTRNKITDISRVSDIYLQQQSQSDAEIMRITSQRTMAKYIYDLLRSKSAHLQLLPTNSGINNQVAEAQITQYNSLLLTLKNNMTATSTQNPLIIKQQAELDDIRRNILATVDNQIKTIDIQLQALQNYYGEANSKIVSNPTQAKHLASVEREQKVKEGLYLYLLQKKEENEISMTYSSMNTEIIDMPHGSDAPVSPNRRMVMFSAVFFALLLPTVVIFVSESMGTTVRDKYDIARKTTVPFIGEIPYIERNNYKNPLQKWMARKRTLTMRTIVVEAGKQDPINEAFRMLRTDLEFMTSRPGDRNVYIVTSSYEGSGKTFVATNLAVSLSISGKRVLFIDGDLRHASASRVFGKAHKGLSDYLSENEDDLLNVLLHVDKYPTLDIITAGTIPPNPTELLSGRRLAQMLKELRPLYDFVIIDCPLAESLADTGLIERNADRTLFVIRAGMFERKKVEDLEIDSINGKYKNIGIVLNGTKFAGRYGYRNGYRYGYRNGYRYGYYDENSKKIKR